MGAEATTAADQWRVYVAYSGPMESRRWRFYKSNDKWVVSNILNRCKFECEDSEIWNIRNAGH
jgi:hypothetical protein